MDVIERLKEEGFDQVLVLDGPSCGIAEKTLLLAMAFYPSQETPPPGCAWIHPYYPVSQKAYQSANRIVLEAQEAGVKLRLNDDLRVKPIFARIPGLTQGRNTISYYGMQGSRFHVQILALDEEIEPNTELLPGPKALHCGSCRRCFELCPTHAIDEEGFHRERCLRNWQLSGKVVPISLRALMGSRLLGCDSCQVYCPHNPQPSDQPNMLDLEAIFSDLKSFTERIKTVVGVNLAIHNRVVAQLCLLAGCSNNKHLLPYVTDLARHPSPVVAQHAAWARDRLAAIHEEKVTGI